MSRKKQRATGFDALQEAFDRINYDSLIDSLGVDIPQDLLMLALTHRSFANENGTLPNNERLEFLGDAVLGLSVAGKLYEQYPSRAESDISKMRASIVSRYGLADIAREIKLGSFILLGKGELMTNGRDKESILADTTEALLGAIYLAHGFEVARATVLRLFQKKIDTASAVGVGMHQDWKTTLQERAAERKLPVPVYTASSTGPEHSQTFTAVVTVGTATLGEGIGPNKKLAEQAAAHKAVVFLQENPTFS
ncbi:ribonuclease III [Corynebacterium silvaticum]|uniref:ribonuclease III n=1 Tax=Corynebacterium silvaticum TaxID=2320431 RepID=UPI001067E098|nr:ribonuclease III [Corynebacterium silvaticum]MBH5299553.1 ribonuclease III [Corynebacterium silvaticum]NOM64128.1 ribonuclease III [Corynebacterium silvaticum]TFA93977.1 ribonuclease III [Corynebacterium silvaticum]TFA97186.1 ribonuclease III [Corynebacterium silvaticum]TNX85572.1 ribonuclease III [Corynebacterium silvaticum]